MSARLSRHTDLRQIPNSRIRPITRYAKYLLCFILPLSTFSFLLIGLITQETHSAFAAIGWILPFWLLLLADALSHQVETESIGLASSASALFFDGILYALSALQVTNILIMAFYISQFHWETAIELFTNLVNLVVIRFLVGTSSGTSGIVVAHELIHRPERSWQRLGRLLLCTVGYDHFVIAHLRGHHVRINMPEDVATAKLGESFNDFWHRAYLGDIRYAWASERQRLALETDKHWLLHHQVVHGIIVELLLLALILAFCGGVAAILFLYQAIAAVRILETVNYFQHWGLAKGQFGNTFGWVSPSWISRYVLIGLPHHIGHHEDENKHFHEIAYSEQGPLLPYGYLVMNLWVKLNNASYQRMAKLALKTYKNSQLNSPN